MALSDFWEIKDNQVYGGKSLLNVYHLKKIDGGSNAAIVAQAFLDWVVDGGLAAIQPDGLSRTTIEVANLALETDFATLDSSGSPGLLAGQDLPSFNTATVQFNRTRNDMKNGVKRWYAGTEAEQDGGNWATGMVTLLDALAAVIMTPWEDDGSPGIEVGEFCILKRFCVVPAQDPCLVYRLPSTSVEADENHYVPVTATTRARVRSQVSRKVLQ